MLYVKLAQHIRHLALLVLFGGVVCTTFMAASPTVFAAPAKSGGDCSQLEHCDLINKYIEPFIAFLSAAVGLAVVGSIIIGGIQYGSSANDPSKVTAAKNRIRNAILALITYIFLFSLLNFLVPGGIL